MKRLAIAFFALAALQAAADEPSFKVGDVIANDLCPSPAKSQWLSQITQSKLLGNGLFDSTLTCGKDPNIYLLKRDYKKPGAFVVGAVIPRDSKEGAFVSSSGLGGSILPLFARNENGTVVSNKEIVFFLEKSAENSDCHGGIELTSLSLSIKPSPDKTDWETGFLKASAIYTPTKYAGVCLPLRKVKENEGHKGRLDSLGIEGLNVLDMSLEKDGKNLYLLAYSVSYLGGSLVEPGLRVLHVDLAAQTASVVFELDSKKFDVSGCGAYLNGARLLPGSQKLVLFYKRPAVRIVDYSNPGDVKVEEVYRDENFFGGTCEGYVPGYTSLRNGSPGGGAYVDIQPKKRLIFYVTRKWDKIPAGGFRELPVSEPFVIKLEY